VSEMEVTPTLFTADYVGEPGRRTFYLQARTDAGTLSFLLEKQQVSVLADRLRELLMALDGGDSVGTSVPERDPALALAEPVEPEWRVGTMGLAYQQDEDRVLLVLQASEEEEGDDQDAVRFALRRDQVRTFVLHAQAIVDEGRPLCQLCGLPIDPSGHACPASNGHRLSVI
jgi:uncharacterized repeat protein (TIGR03847 family)